MAVNRNIKKLTDILKNFNGDTMTSLFQRAFARLLHISRINTKSSEENEKSKNQTSVNLMNLKFYFQKWAKNFNKCSSTPIGILQSTLTSTSLSTDNTDDVINASSSSRVSHSHHLPVIK